MQTTMYTLKPNGCSSNSYWSNVEYMYDGDVNTAATRKKTLLSSADANATLTLNFADMLNIGTPITMTLYVKAASTKTIGKLFVSLGGIDIINMSPSSATTLFDRNFTEHISTVLNNPTMVVKFIGSPSFQDSSFTGSVYDIYLECELQTSYMVTFIDWNGSVLSQQEVSHKTAATAPSNPIRSGYEFTGWDKSFNSITEDTVVTAQYKYIPYVANFLDWDGTILKTQSSDTAGFNATPPSNPSREGYTFIGWGSSYTNINDNRNIYALYELNNSTNKKSIEGLFFNCSSFNKECSIPDKITNMNNLFNGCKSLNSKISISISSGNNPDMAGIFSNTSVDYVCIKNYIDETIFNNLLNSLIKPSTLDLTEASLMGVQQILSNSNLMNMVNLGSHTLKYTHQSYNYLKLLINNSTGFTVTLYDPSTISSNSIPYANYITDWGDGIIDNLRTHTYAQEGEYLIRTNLTPGSGNGGANNPHVIECTNIRNDITNLDYFFSNCINLTTISAIIPDNITTVNNIFSNCDSLISLDLSYLNVSTIMNLNNMFDNCSSLELLNLSNWNINNSALCSNMFNNCSNLKEIFMNNSNSSSINMIVDNLTNRTKPSPGFMYVDDVYGGVNDASSNKVNTDIAKDKWWGVLDKFNYFVTTTSPGTVTLAAHKFIDLTYEAVGYTDWGDGTVDTNVSHSYSGAGPYIIKTKLQAATADKSAQMGITEASADKYCNCNIDSAIRIRYDITTLDSFFFRSKVSKLDLTLYNAKNITNIRRCFGRVLYLKYLDVSNWNVENVKGMGGTFMQAPLEGMTDSSKIMDLSAWRLPNVGNINDLFSKEPDDAFNVFGNLLNKVTHLNLSGWGMQSCTNIKAAFYGCQYLEELNLSGWQFTDGNIKNYDGCFTLTPQLKKVIIKDSNPYTINTIMSLMLTRSDNAGEIIVSSNAGLNSPPSGWTIKVEP